MYSYVTHEQVWCDCEVCPALVEAGGVVEAGGRRTLVYVHLAGLPCISTIVINTYIVLTTTPSEGGTCYVTINNIQDSCFYVTTYVHAIGYGYI